MTGGGMAGMMLLMGLGWIIVLGALVAGIWWLVREVRSRGNDQTLASLRERYARGEISREEFEARRRDLVA